MTTDWLPTRRAEQLAMAKTWAAVLAEKGPQWEVTNAERLELGVLIENADSLFTKVMSVDRNIVVTAQTNTAFANLTIFMRALRRRRFLIPPLTEPGLVSLGLRPRDRVYTPVPNPTSQAEGDITYPGPHLLRLHLKPIAGTLEDPRADHGFRVYFGILPPGGAAIEEAAGPGRYLMRPPATGGELPHSQFSRRRKVLMEFPAEDSGKTAYFSVRYENSKGGKGPWGPVFSAIIP